MIQILLNGEARSVDAGTTILDMLGSLGVEASRVAVEVDRRIVKQAEWPSTELHAGAEVEVVHFVGGGCR